MSWRVITAVVLVAVALFSGWSAWNNRDRRSEESVDPDRSSYVLRDFQMTALDKEGKESVTLQAPYMQSSSEDKSYTVQTPLFLVPDANGAYWETRSKTAWISPEGDKAILQDDVVANSAPGSANPTDFKTTRLDILPNENRAVTDQPVTLTQPGSILTGRGFEVNLDTRQYKFNSQVKSRYVPNSAR
ncbi:MAG: LPS export ABC transporter periplasmic protein LptC [Pseudoxanthomonas sp.]